MALAIERLGGGSEGMIKLSQLLSTTIEVHDHPPTKPIPSSRILMDKNCVNNNTASSALAPDSLRLSEKPVRVSCNAGSVDLDHEIMFGGFNFKANDKSQDNVLSQGDLEAAGHKVEYNSDWGYYKVSKDGRTAKV